MKGIEKRHVIQTVNEKIELKENLEIRLHDRHNLNTFSAKVELK